MFDHNTESFLKEFKWTQKKRNRGGVYTDHALVITVHKNNPSNGTQWNNCLRLSGALMESAGLKIGDFVAVGIKRNDFGKTFLAIKPVNENDGFMISQCSKTDNAGRVTLSAVTDPSELFITKKTFIPRHKIHEQSGLLIAEVPDPDAVEHNFDFFE